MTDEHDDDRTSPDLGAGDDPTQPGIGVDEAFIAITASAHRFVAALEALSSGCPPRGDPRRERHLEVYAHQWGELGMMCFDARRITLSLQREEKGNP